MKFFNRLKWGAAHIAWATMAYSPVAMGVEAEQLNKQKLNQYVQEFGLNKKITLGELWEKSKGYFPGYEYRELETFIQNNKNVQLPEIIVTSSKGTDGSEIPVLQIYQNGKTTTLQFYGDKNRWVKLNNVNLSALDLQKSEDLFKRVIANDIKVKQEYDQLKKKMTEQRSQTGRTQVTQQKDFRRFKGFPVMTPQQWKIMTPTLRAQYLTSMHAMWKSAQKVNQQSMGQKSSFDPKFEQFLKSILGDQAHAVDAIKKPTTCVVAGYAGPYPCNIDKALKEREANPIIGKANSKCVQDNGANSRACNPIIYGYPSGKPACVDIRSDAFQRATVYQGACDKQSPLVSKEVFAFNDKDYSNILPREKQIQEIDKDQVTQQYKLTQDFLAGVLANKESPLADALKNGKWSQDLEDAVFPVQKAFEEEINMAIQKCEANVQFKIEKNQKSACDQLHRRWLFTEKLMVKLRQNACAPGTKYIGSMDKLDDLKKDSFLCECVINKDQKAELGKDANCTGTRPPVASVIADTPQEPQTEKPAFSCPAGASQVGENKCVCANNKDIDVPEGSTPENVKQICEEKSDWWKWALGLGLAALIGKLIYNRHKKKDPPTQPNHPLVCDAGKKLVGDQCVCSNTCGPNATLNPQSCSCDIAPVIPTCPAPKVGTPPVCVCPASNSCTPGQQIYNQATCQCDNVPQPVTCANERPPVNGACPKCPDGTPEPPNGCPTRNEGGTGNNCPSGNCNGGGPTAN